MNKSEIIQNLEKQFDEKFGNLGIYEFDELELLEKNARKFLETKSFFRQLINKIIK